MNPHDGDGGPCFLDFLPELLHHGDLIGAVLASFFIVFGDNMLKQHLVALDHRIQDIEVVRDAYHVTRA